MVYENGHADFILEDVVTQACQKGVRIVETGKHLANRTEHAALFWLIRIAGTGACVVPVQVVRHTAAEAVVQARPGEDVTVLHIGGTAETQSPLGIKSGCPIGQCMQHSVLLL